MQRGLNVIFFFSLDTGGFLSCVLEVASMRYWELGMIGWMDKAGVMSHVRAFGRDLYISTARLIEFAVFVEKYQVWNV